MKHTIFVIGLGAGELDQLSVKMYKTIQNCSLLYARTKDHPVIRELETEGTNIASFDEIYEKHDQFEQVYTEIVEILCKKVEENDIYYAVPGHPLVAEKTVQLLLDKRIEGVQVVIEGGNSFLDPLFTALEIDPIQGFQMVDGTDLRGAELQIKQHIVICQVYNQLVASEVKLTLMQRLPDNYEVYIVTAAGTSNQVVKKVPLYELDHGMNLNNLTTVYVPPVQEEAILIQEFDTFRSVIAALRGPNGCPWDKEQTHISLKPYLLEEAYEAIEAIDEEDDAHLIEELGDVLLQVMLHAQIGEDEGWFTINDVIRTVTEKMIRRHPHVFGDKTAENASDVMKHWDEIKKQEKKEKTVESIFDDIPKSFPGLLMAYKIQKKAAKVGFDWEEVDPIWDKIHEEIQEFQMEIQQNSTKDIASKEFGDILFALVNLGRFYQIDPEVAISQTNQKFMKRFQYMENRIHEKKLKITDLSLEELDLLWEESKKKK
ncbi:nucleoside triphosphate pyrophosphohydrolase [Bacillus sp. DJP31]|uniref:nucleoside triphosphate pyrophosphohydrolase n=1 Tax=Bacillus sp. DJP31 TaxID=3409789 RepID=UPI003BB6C825